MKHLYTKTVLGLFMLFIAPQFLMAQPFSRKARKEALAARAKAATTSTTEKKSKSLVAISNNANNVKPRLLALTTQTKQVTLLDRKESNDQKTYYKWNEYGHLLSELVYVNSIGDEWTLDIGYSRIYEYDYADGKCIRQATYSVSSEGKKDIELQRIVASTDAEGIYRETTYDYDKDSTKLLISGEIGYDKFGNLTTDISYDLGDDGTIYKYGYDRRFTKNVTNAYGNYIDNYSDYCTMELYYNSDGHVQGYKTERVETADSWTYKRYEWNNDDNDFSLEEEQKYVWNGDHDRIICVSEKYSGNDETVTNITYDALKRPVKMVITTGDDTYTNTYTYASGTAVFDYTKPVYTVYDSDNKNKLPKDIAIAMESLDLAYMSTYGPVSQFSVYHEDGYHIKGTATFDADFRCKTISAENYYSASEDPDNLERNAKIDFYHKSDGRLDYYVTTEEEDGDTYIEKTVINYNADGRREGCSCYVWGNEAWNLTDVEYESYDDEGRILMNGYKYKNEDKWSGYLTKHTYDSSGNASSTYYEWNDQTGEWEEYNYSEFSSEYEENGFKVYVNDYEKRYVWISPSKKPQMPMDFFSLYDAHPLEDGLYSTISDKAQFSIHYYKFDDSSDYTFEYANGEKDYWRDSNTYVVEYYDTRDSNLTPNETVTYTVDSHNRVVNHEAGDIEYEYTYLDDTNLLLTSSDGTSTTKYYYSSHDMVDGVNTPNAADTKLFTCTGRHIESQQPMKIYNVAGQCIAAGITDITLSAPGLYIVKVGAETSKINVR